MESPWLDRPLQGYLPIPWPHFLQSPNRHGCQLLCVYCVSDTTSASEPKMTGHIETFDVGWAGFYSRPSPNPQLINESEHWLQGVPSRFFSQELDLWWKWCGSASAVWVNGEHRKSGAVGRLCFCVCCICWYYKSWSGEG